MMAAASAKSIPSRNSRGGIGVRTAPDLEPGPGGGFLIRLYDVRSPASGAGEALVARPGRPADILQAVALAADAIDAEQIRLAFASSPIRAAVASDGGKLTACCLYDAAGRGMLGPVFTAAGAGRDLSERVLRAACGLMLRAGYWYALADWPAPGDGPALLPEAAVAVPPRPSSLSLHQRDAPGPKVDLFLPLGDDFGRAGSDQFTVGQRTVYVRRPIASNRIRLTQWVTDEFGKGWASEVECAFQQQPVSVLFATRSTVQRTDDLLGFVAYGVSGQGMIGPSALRPSARGTTIAAILLDRCLREMYRDGFGYAILGAMVRRRALLRVLSQAWAIPGSYPALFPVDGAAADVPE
jgi:hypothetical protein